MLDVKILPPPPPPATTFLVTTVLTRTPLLLSFFLYTDRALADVVESWETEVVEEEEEEESCGATTNVERGAFPGMLLLLLLLLFLLLLLLLRLRLLEVKRDSPPDFEAEVVGGTRGGGNKTRGKGFFLSSSPCP